MRNIILLTILTITTSCGSIKNEDKDFLKGYFSYFADAALFIDCKTNEKYPVAMEDDYIYMEKEYLEITETDGQRILVTLNGVFIERDKIEGEGKQKFLIVNEFIGFLPNDSCE